MTIANLNLQDTMNTQMNRINQIIDLLNASGESGKYSVVATQANLPAINAAPDQLYIVRNHTDIGQACIVFDSSTSGRTWVPLGKSVDSGNTAIKVTTDGAHNPSTMRAYYIGSDGLAHAADSTDDNKTATGYMDSQGFLVTVGTVRYAANGGDPIQTLVPGTTYYYNSTGLLTTTPAGAKKVGIAITNSLLLVNMSGTGSGSSSIETVNTETDLPPIATATANLYIIKNYVEMKGPALAAIVNGEYRYSPLKTNPINGNSWVYIDPTALGTGVGVNNLVYLDSTGKWQLADYRDSAKFAQAIVAPNNAIVFHGVIKLTGGTLVQGQRYYCSSVGTLTTGKNPNQVGFAIDSDTLQITIDLYGPKQSDWDQTDNTKEDYIKNKPGIVSKTAIGFVPALPNDTDTDKFFRQDGTYAIPVPAINYVYPFSYQTVNMANTTDVEIALNKETRKYYVDLISGEPNPEYDITINNLVSPTLNIYEYYEFEIYLTSVNAPISKFKILNNAPINGGIWINPLPSFYYKTIMIISRVSRTSVGGYQRLNDVCFYS